MNKIIFLVLISSFLFACDTDKSKREAERNARKSEVIEASQLPLIVESENGEYIEWYPGRKQMKIKGRKDEEGRRVGIWKAYFENGVEQSILTYNKEGQRDGIYIVRYPNNLLHYRGEYEADEPVGEWLFYDEEGNLTETKDYNLE